MTHDKCLESIRLNLPEKLKNDLQDLAAMEDRAVSETIRLILEDRLYGLARKLCHPEPLLSREDR